MNVGYEATPSVSYRQFSSNFKSMIHEQNDLTNVFSLDQIDFICESMYLWRDGERLVHFFKMDSFNYFYSENCCPSSAILRGYLYALFHNKKYDELFKVMSNNRFEDTYHAELTELWYEARYAEDQLRKHKLLGPVDKYRIRKKFPPPSTVWDGDEVIYSFKECARKVLKSFYERNKYPTSEEKREIASQTRLRIVQIANWFKNRRQRDKEK